MYRDYFGFTDDPFRMTPDTRYLFDSSRHQEAISALLYGISERKGFIVISGEIGTGKTTMVRSLLNQLNPKIKTAVILNPRLSESELLHAILDDLGVEVPETNPSQKVLLDKLNAFLLDASARGENVAVIIDEAQNLDAEVLESIRLLSNLETEQEKLIQIILVGQPELNDILRHPRLEQLRSRIAVRYHITPLEGSEIPAYIRHRLRIAGDERAVAFTEGAFRRISEYTRGVPRLINVIADKCLLGAFVLERREVDEGLVGQAIKDHEGPAPRVPAAGAAALLPREGGPRPFHWGLLGAGAGIAALVLVVAWVGLQTFRGSHPPAAVAARPGNVPVVVSGGTLSPRSEPSSTAALREVLVRWRPGSEGDARAAADPEALAKSLGLVAVRVTANIRALESIDLPVVLPVARPEGTTHIALLAAAGATYEILEPGTLGRPGGVRRIPRTPERLDPRPYPGALLLLPDDPLLGGNLNPGSSGPRVARLQEILRGMGETVADPPGVFGASTRDAIRRFQVKVNLPEDGLVGPLTAPALLSRATDGAPRLGR